MTLRGRLTLAALALLAVALLWRSGQVLRGQDAPVVAESAAAPPPAAGLEAPSALAARLPPSARGARVEWPAARDANGARDEPLPLQERVDPPPGFEELRGPLQLEYTLDPELTRRVRRILERGRVSLGHVIVLDVQSGRVLAYVVTDPERMPASRAYPAASLMKVVTASAVLEHAPGHARRPCRYLGNPYRLTRARLDPPSRGRSVSLRHALATSNNQCFAQLAVHALGSDTLVAQMRRLGLLAAPAQGHEAGRLAAVDDALDLGRLGCGLDGCRITSLAAARLAAVLAGGQLVVPHWVERVTDAAGRELALPEAVPRRRVLPARVARELREMLVDTTRRGTARRAFRNRRGPLLGPIRVAGKTGSLTGRDPTGRYEWFIGVAPADGPQIAVATLVVQSDLWWISSSQLAAEVMKAIFCPKGVCRVDAAARWLGPSLG